MTFDGAHPVRPRTGRGLPYLIAFLTAGLLVVLGVALSPAASAAPAITVTPSTGLHDGQTVSVHGTGYTPNAKNLNVIQCPVSGAGQNTCNVPDAKIFQSVDGSGSFTYTIVVRAKIGSVDCTKVQCMIDAHEGTSATSGNDSSVVLHFGSTTTSSSASSGGSNNGSGSGSGSGSTGGSSGTGSGGTGGSGSTPGAGNPTGADTGYQDIGTPRIAVTLGLIGLGVLLLLTGTAVHLRRRPQSR